MDANGDFLYRFDQLEHALSVARSEIQGAKQDIASVNQSISSLAVSIDKFREVVGALVEIHENAVPIKLVYYMFAILMFAFGGGAAVGAFKHIYNIP